MAYDYSSTQVNLPPKHAKAVQDFAADIDPDDLHETEKNEDVPHITVKYGLHTDDHRDVAKALESEPPANATINGLSMFERDDKDYDVLKYDVDSRDLERLNGIVAKTAPHTDTFPEYHPHVTVAYLKKGRGKKYVHQATPMQDMPSVNFDTVHFSSKSGNIVPMSLNGEPNESAVRRSVKESDNDR
jgi:2'-5' RNA ligase